MPLAVQSQPLWPEAWPCTGGSRPLPKCTAVQGLDSHATTELMQQRLPQNYLTKYRIAWHIWLAGLLSQLYNADLQVLLLN